MQQNSNQLSFNCYLHNCGIIEKSFHLLSHYIWTFISFPFPPECHYYCMHNSACKQQAYLRETLELQSFLLFNDIVV